jgi:hypothetical protein
VRSFSSFAVSFTISFPRLIAIATQVVHTETDRRSDLHEFLPDLLCERVRWPGAPKVTLALTDFAPGPKDMIDAVAAAATVLAFARGEGAEVGGGDGLGTIVLPRALTGSELNHPVHRWPGGRSNA